MTLSCGPRAVSAARARPPPAELPTSPSARTPCAPSQSRASLASSSATGSGAETPTAPNCLKGRSRRPVQFRPNAPSLRATSDQSDLFSPAERTGQELGRYVA
jgi:hypothetical protein